MSHSRWSRQDCNKIPVVNYGVDGGRSPEVLEIAGSQADFSILNRGLLIEAQGAAGIHDPVGIEVLFERREQGERIRADLAPKPGGGHFADAVMMAHGGAVF